MKFKKFVIAAVAASVAFAAFGLYIRKWRLSADAESDTPVEDIMAEFGYESEEELIEDPEPEDAAEFEEVEDNCTDEDEEEEEMVLDGEPLGVLVKKRVYDEAEEKINIFYDPSENVVWRNHSKDREVLSLEQVINLIGEIGRLNAITYGGEDVFYVAQGEGFEQVVKVERGEFNG